MFSHSLRLLNRLPAIFRVFSSFPAHELLKMPALSPTMTEGTIVKWNKKEGEKVSPGDVMFEVETDKAVVGYEVQDEVYIAKVLSNEGSSKIPLGHPVAVLVSKADRVAAFKDFSLDQASSAPVPPTNKTLTPEPAQSSPPTPSAQHSSSTRLFISPLAKMLAKENKLDYSSLRGSGPNNRIIKADILSALASKKSAPAAPAPATPVFTSETSEDRAGYKDVPNSQMRKVTAARLLESKQKIPHMYILSDCNMTKLNKLRKVLNESGDTKVSVNDLVIKAAALACVKVPEVNSSWNETSVRIYDHVDVSIAVQTPKGLITPIVKNAHHKRIGEIAKEVKSLAATAKEGKLKPEQFIGGTFTVSNLGMFGVKEFFAIINPPQACILSVGASEDRVIPSGDGFKVENFMTVALSCDHRVIDGVIGANWLKAFKEYIEEPYTMLY